MKKNIQPKKCEFDIVVFGASGFTGKYVVAEVARAFLADPRLTFAVAGRNVEKLQQALVEVQEKHCTGHQSLFNVRKIVANVDDMDSLLAMASQANVIINCVGPYAFYGDPVVRACIQARCSHIDLSGEQPFLDGIQLRYDSEARQAGVYIVGSCGFDTIPSDLGVIYTDMQFSGDLNSVEGFFSMETRVSGPLANYGTFASAVNIFRDKNKTHNQNRQLFHNKPMPVFSHPLKQRGELFYSHEMSAWCHRFPGCDRSVVKRTQYKFYHYDHRRFVQYGVYVCEKSIVQCLLTTAAFFYFVVMCSFRLTRWLMLLFPNLFTLGWFNRQGPSRDQIANSSFTLNLFGRGYRSKTSDPGAQHSDVPDSSIVTRVTGPDPGYITTPICAVTAALMIVNERINLPHQGGVYTPGAAFANTSIINQLQGRGITFRVIEAQK